MLAPHGRLELQRPRVWASVSQGEAPELRVGVCSRNYLVFHVLPQGGNETESWWRGCLALLWALGKPFIWVVFSPHSSHPGDQSHLTGA